MLHFLVCHLIIMIMFITLSMSQLEDMVIRHFVESALPHQMKANYAVKKLEFCTIIIIIIINNKKRSHTQLDSRKQVIAFQDRVMTINIKEAQHPLK